MRKPLTFCHMNNRNFYQFILAFSIIVSTLFVCTIQAQTPKAEAHIDASKQVNHIIETWDNNQSPGVAISIIKDGLKVYQKGVGKANLEYEIPISASTIFHVASIAKQFTAFSILLLEREDKLSLDDDIRKYIPEVPDFGNIITLKHLLFHTSGIRDHGEALALAGWRDDDVITKEHIFKMVSRQKELNFEPGSNHLYSNTGYTLLAEVVERITGKTFAEFTNLNIFQPLKMTNTLFYDDYEKIVKNRAYSYYNDEAQYKKRILNYSSVGASNLLTTIEDLSLWVLNFENPIIGNSEILLKMEENGVLNNGEEINYAFGQVIDSYKGLKRISHGGVDAGFRAFLVRFPSEKFSIIIASNDASFDVRGVANKITDIYLKDKIGEEIKIDTTVEIDKSIVIDQRVLSAYEGNYQVSPDFIIKITNDKGKLIAQPTGLPKAKLIAFSPTKFEVQGVGVNIEFQPEHNGQVDLIKVNIGGQLKNAYRIASLDLTKINLSDYTGTFISDELSTTYSIVIEGDNIIAKHFRLGDIKLNLVKKDICSSSTLFFGKVEFTRDFDNQINGFKITNARVKNLNFKKKKN